MPNRSRPAYEAALLADRQLAEVGRELRMARIASGRTQAEIGRAIGLSASEVSRIERERIRKVSYRTLAILCGVVGLRPSLKVWPAGRRLLDQPQLELLKGLQTRAHQRWTWSTEVPLPIPGDLRAVDARSTVPGCQVIYELWTRLSDFQAQARAAQLKKRDIMADHLVIVVRDTHANRRAVRLAEPAITQAFPLTTRTVLEALKAGRCPAGDGLVFL